MINADAERQEVKDVIERLKEACALFILGTKERFKLTQVATQGIIEGVTNLMQVTIIILQLLALSACARDSTSDPGGLDLN